MYSNTPNKFDNERGIYHMILQHTTIASLQTCRGQASWWSRMWVTQSWIISMSIWIHKVVVHHRWNCHRSWICTGNRKEIRFSVPNHRPKKNKQKNSVENETIKKNWLKKKRASKKSNIHPGVSKSSISSSNCLKREIFWDCVSEGWTRTKFDSFDLEAWEKTRFSCFMNEIKEEKNPDEKGTKKETRCHLDRSFAGFEFPRFVKLPIGGGREFWETDESANNRKDIRYVYMDNNYKSNNETNEHFFLWENHCDLRQLTNNAPRREKN